MAARLKSAGVFPDAIVASPAKRARKTARMIAKGVGYDRKQILYLDELYSGSFYTQLKIIGEQLGQHSVIFMVGHNHTLTELGEYLTKSHLGNVPTCGVVGVGFKEHNDSSCDIEEGQLLVFDFPKNNPAEIKGF